MKHILFLIVFLAACNDESDDDHCQLAIPGPDSHIEVTSVQTDCAEDYRATEIWSRLLFSDVPYKDCVIIDAAESESQCSVIRAIQCDFPEGDVVWHVELDSIDATTLVGTAIVTLDLGPLTIRDASKSPRRDPCITSYDMIVTVP